MKYTIIYGTKQMAKIIFHQIEAENNHSPGGGYDILFTDPDVNLHGTLFCGKLVIPPEKISDYDYDKVVVGSVMAFDDVAWELEHNHGIPKEKIDLSYSATVYNKTLGARIRWLENFAEIADFKKYDGNCAEVGVFNGSFAKQINRCFPNKKLYLFDTFTGFDVRDIAVERENSLAVGWNEGTFAATFSPNVILQKMPHPEQVIFKVGYFPNTANGIEDKFTFVNLDVDLYAPTLAGLEFFYPKLVKGGAILIHDYFPGLLPRENGDFVGIKKAVEEFSSRYNVPYIPIADLMSVAFMKC